MLDDKNNKISTGVPIDETFAEKKEEPVCLFKRIFFHSWLKYLISFLISVVVALIVLINKGFNYLVSYSDAFFVGGTIILGVGLLSMLSSFGTFDIFSYSGKYVFNKMRSKDMENYPDYSKGKALNREETKFSFIPYLVVGGFEIIISIVILIIN